MDAGMAKVAIDQEYAIGEVLGEGHGQVYTGQGFCLRLARRW